jgi:hypothetical protein
MEEAWAKTSFVGMGTPLVWEHIENLGNSMGGLGLHIENLGNIN